MVERYYHKHKYCISRHLGSYSNENELHLFQYFHFSYILKPSYKKLHGFYHALCLKWFSLISLSHI